MIFTTMYKEKFRNKAKKNKKIIAIKENPFSIILNRR